MDDLILVAILDLRPPPSVERGTIARLRSTATRLADRARARAISAAMLVPRGDAALLAIDARRDQGCRRRSLTGGQIGSRTANAQMTAHHLRPQRPQPQPARHARAARFTARETLDDIAAALSERAGELGVELDIRQSNHEGHLIDWLHEAGASGAKAVILNAGGYTHTSVAIRDAVAAIACAGDRGASVQPRRARKLPPAQPDRRRSRKGSIKGFGAHELHAGTGRGGAALTGTAAESVQGIDNGR